MTPLRGRTGLDWIVPVWSPSETVPFFLLEQVIILHPGSIIHLFPRTGKAGSEIKSWWDHVLFVSLLNLVWSDLQFGISPALSMNVWFQVSKLCVKECSVLTQINDDEMLNQDLHVKSYAGLWRFCCGDTGFTFSSRYNLYKSAMQSQS